MLPKGIETFVFNNIAISLHRLGPSMAFKTARIQSTTFYGGDNSDPVPTVE